MKTKDVRKTIARILRALAVILAGMLMMAGGLLAFAYYRYAHGLGEAALLILTVAGTVGGLGMILQPFKRWLEPR